MAVEMFFCFRVHSFLDGCKKGFYMCGEVFDCDVFFGVGISADDNDLVFGEVFWSEFNADRHAFQFPFVVFPSGHIVFAVVDLHSVFLCKGLLDLACFF